MKAGVGAVIPAPIEKRKPPHLQHLAVEGEEEG
jgi:hypothetical protein